MRRKYYHAKKRHQQKKARLDDDGISKETPVGNPSLSADNNQEEAKDASVSECTWKLSALEALCNALYKFKTYLLTYFPSDLHYSASAKQQAVGGRPPQYVPAPLLPLWAPKRLAPPS